MPIASVGLNRRQRVRPQRSGYVLIMTLVMIAVAALSLAGLARRSLLLANESITAQRELQRHWGANSCRHMLLDHAGEIFEHLETPYLDGELPWPSPSLLSAEITLSGMRYHLRLSDEDAKLNLNTLTARLPQRRREILGQLLEQQESLQLHPDNSPFAKQKKRWFSSWGQVVDINQFENKTTKKSFYALTDQVTCWGNGKLNIRRVSDQILLLIAGKIVNQKVAQKLLDARAEASDIDWKELLKSLAVRRREELALRTWFTDRSSCFCLWLELEDGQRRWYHQWVQGDRADVTTDSVLSFRW